MLIIGCRKKSLLDFFPFTLGSASELSRLYGIHQVFRSGAFFL